MERVEANAILVRFDLASGQPFSENFLRGLLRCWWQ
jgi:hypothetical protein